MRVVTVTFLLAALLTVCVVLWPLPTAAGAAVLLTGWAVKR